MMNIVIVMDHFLRMIMEMSKTQWRKNKKKRKKMKMLTLIRDNMETRLHQVTLRFSKIPSDYFFLHHFNRT